MEADKADSVLPSLLQKKNEPLPRRYSVVVSVRVGNLTGSRSYGHLISFLHYQKVHPAFASNLQEGRHVGRKFASCSDCELRPQFSV